MGLDYQEPTLRLGSKVPRADGTGVRHHGTRRGPKGARGPAGGSIARRGRIFTVEIFRRRDRSEHGLDLPPWSEPQSVL